MTLGSPASMIETHELVVPKSIPIILLIVITPLFLYLGRFVMYRPLVLLLVFVIQY